jgi:8-oxo-dGTP pyrophosphatase MutT (NUDIX family)
LKFHAHRPEKLDSQVLPNMFDVPWHLTASAVVIVDRHILLIHHKRIGAWLPPGGHLQPAELPHLAAIRETLEETGVSVKVVCEPLPASSDPQAFFLPQPLCMHGVFAQEKGESVYHVDCAYLCLPEGLAESTLPELTVNDEVDGARWHRLSAIHEISLAKNVEGIVALALAKLQSSTAANVSQSD